MADMMTISQYNIFERLRLSIMSLKVAPKRLLLVAVFAVLYILASTRYPMGDWDARAMWNLRAKLIYAHGFTIAYTAEPDHAHLDYPPLLPLIIAGGWHLTSADTPIPAIVHGFIFMALVWTASKQLWTGVLVGVVGLAYGATQSADTAIATLLLGAMLAELQNRRGAVGLLLGLAALTKNEGILMLLCYIIVVSLYERRVSFVILRGASVPVLCLVAFKLLYPIPNDVVTGSGLLDRLTDFNRYWIIALYLVPATLQFGTGALLISACCLWGLRLKVKPNIAVVTVLLIWLGYIGIYIITPHDLIWHLSSSYDRLLWQLFPALVCGLVFPHVSERSKP